MSTSPESSSLALTPQDWCRRILASLGVRRAQGPEAGTLEMLLSYCLQLNPSPETFLTLLDQYITSSRPDMAQAAQLLRDSWLLGQSDAPIGASPTLEETLRSLGGLLDDCGAPAAYLVAAVESVHFQAFGNQYPLQLRPLELRRAIAARIVLRGQVEPTDPTGAERYETRLRIIGAELDEQDPQAYEILITRRTSIIEGSGGYYRICTAEGLTPALQAAPERRDAGPLGQE